MKERRSEGAKERRSEGAKERRSEGVNSPHHYNMENDKLEMTVKSSSSNETLTFVEKNF